jgi:outer membrane biosynthesis protein TonB
MSRQGKSTIWGAALLVACAAIGLAAPALAAAEESEFYSAFSRCQTDVPEMNDPVTEEAACFSNTSHHGTVQIGSFNAKLAGPTDIQFGVAGVVDEEIVKTVPGSTTVTAFPIFIPNPFVAAPAEESDPPASKPKPGSPEQPAPDQTNSSPKAPTVQPVKKNPQKSHKKKAKRKHRKHKKKANRSRAHGRVQATTAAEVPKIKATFELAGDVTEFNLLVAASEETGKVALRIPVKFHLEGDLLGPNCYIGSDANPIVLYPKKEKAESTFFFGSDPNGFQIRLVGSGGSMLEDATFTVPSSSGCGVGGALTQRVNEFLGIPAAAGESRVVLTDNTFQFVGAGYDGSAPDGGAELQAAFDAADGK